MSLSSALLDGAETATVPIARGRSAWVQVARGLLDVNGQHLDAGDGAAVTREDRLVLSNGKDAEALVFDLR